jgi:hypothetical protein
MTFILSEFPIAMISSFQHLFLQEGMPAYVSSLAVTFDSYTLHAYKGERAKISLRGQNILPLN